MVCIRCQKRPAIIFVQRMENGQMKNEGYCLHCAREMHMKPVDDLMKQFGMSDEDMDAMEDRMENMMQEMGDMSRPHNCASSTSLEGMLASSLTPLTSRALPANAPPRITSLSLVFAKSATTLAAAIASSEKP